jgi:predicted transposase YdaD
MQEVEQCRSNCREYIFYGRFFSEIVLYLYRIKPGRWLALVIYPKRKTEKPAGEEFEIFFNSPQLMRLYLEDYQDGNDANYGILRVIACRDSDTAQQVRKLE